MSVFNGIGEKRFLYVIEGTLLKVRYDPYPNLITYLITLRYVIRYIMTLILILRYVIKYVMTLILTLRYVLRYVINPKKSFLFRLTMGISVVA